LPLGFTLCFALHWGVYGIWIGLTLALIVISMWLILRWRRDSARIAIAIPPQAQLVDPLP
jgi:multidrug resistance protein, MATE family